MTSNTEIVSHSSDSERLLGRVKWFNNKAGYGFITVTDGSRSGSDIFVHHSAIDVENQQYKYLVQGEYTEFELIKTESQTHEWQASHVSGIRGGKLMCETRRDLKLARNEYRTSTTRSGDDEVQGQPTMPRQKASSTPDRETRPRRTTAPRVRGEGPRESGDKKEWTLVGGKRSDSGKNSRPSVRTSVGKNATVITIESK